MGEGIKIRSRQAVRNIKETEWDDAIKKDVCKGVKDEQCAKVADDRWMVAANKLGDQVILESDPNAKNNEKLYVACGWPANKPAPAFNTGSRRIGAFKELKKCQEMVASYAEVQFGGGTEKKDEKTPEVAFKEELEGTIGKMPVVSPQAFMAMAESALMFIAGVDDDFVNDYAGWNDVRMPSSKMWFETEYDKRHEALEKLYGVLFSKMELENNDDAKTRLQILYRDIPKNKELYFKNRQEIMKAYCVKVNCVKK
jgi:hypothetical protein